MEKFLSNVKSVRPFLLVWTIICLSCADEICEDERISSDADLYFWAPKLAVEKGNGEVLLLFSDPTPFTQYAGPPPTHPDFYNILISEDLATFRLYKRVDYRETTTKVESLVNGKAYYFKVAAAKEQQTQDSNIIMTIPSQEPVVTLYRSGEYPHTNLSTSYDESYLSFLKNDDIHFASIQLDGQPFIDENSGVASWSQEMNKAVYAKYELVGFTLYTSEFKVFDAATNMSTELFKNPLNGSYASQPKFIPGSNDISFWSTEQNSEGMGYDLWRINLDTKEKTRMTYFGERRFLGASNYDWTLAGTSIYMDGMRSFHEPTGIFHFDVATNTISPIITSLWNDRRPSLSPANAKIAFVSDRSGREEIWIYDITAQSSRQITGSHVFHFDSRYSNLQWLDESQLLITAWLDGDMTTVTINVD
jgi:hypothetical protein